jgi:hypothetical protein
MLLDRIRIRLGTLKSPKPIMPLSGSESDNMLRYLQITYADSDRNTASNNDPSALIAYNRSGEIRTP